MYLIFNFLFLNCILGAISSDKVLKPTLGHLHISDLKIDFADSDVLEEHPCGPTDKCDLLIRFCAGIIFHSLPELNKCDYLYHERTYTAGESNLVLRFEEEWPTHPWQLDISIGTKKRKFVFEVFQEFNESDAKSGSFQFEAESADAKVSATLELKCVDGRFGASCNQKCDLTGFDPARWICNSHGKRICYYGWIGANCTDFYCPAGCLMGDCVGPNQCRCRPGFSGRQCDQGSFCSPDEGENVCSGNGYCVENGVRVDQMTEKYRKTGQELSGTCTCYPGYKGRKCERVIANYNSTRGIDSDEDETPIVSVTQQPEALIQSEPTASGVMLVTLIALISMGVLTLAYVIVCHKRTQRSRKILAAAAQLQHNGNITESGVLLI